MKSPLLLQGVFLNLARESVSEEANSLFCNEGATDAVGAPGVDFARGEAAGGPAGMDDGSAGF